MFDVAFLNQLREREMERFLPFIPERSRVLEFGAGTGQQAQYFARHGHEVVAVDLAQSQYAAQRVFAVQDYDGRHLPLPDRSVDVIFSSNVMEHVEDLPTILAEFKRVLGPGGVGVHAMPTPAWRFWTFISAVPTALQAGALAVGHLVSPPPGASRTGAFYRGLRHALAVLLPRGHGTAAEGFTELWTFSAAAWRRIFRRNGMAVIAERPIGLFYTGHMLLGRRLSFETREKLSWLLGSAARIYVVR